jgi:hypothetical protein
LPTEKYSLSSEPTGSGLSMTLRIGIMRNRKQIVVARHFCIDIRLDIQAYLLYFAYDYCSKLIGSCIILSILSLPALVILNSLD